jgi:mannose-1-phosphate guanylyltransferase/mannose-6-phosphate isomerase
MYSVILAWWSGTRLRPISTIQNPKQFINFKNNQSLLQITAERILTINPDPKKCFVSTNQNYQSQTLIQLNSYHIDQTIIEPIKRNTAPAIACIVAYLQHIVWLDDNEIVLICPSDHYIHPIIRFKEYVIQAQEYARQWKIILFGILPTRPETGYGYIEIDTKSSDINTVISPIKSFKEKPDLETAQTYCDAGNYFWNAGIFMFQLGTIKKEFAQYCPKIANQINLDYDLFIEQFGNMPDVPIDIAIMEKTKKSMVVPMIINRSDIGSRDSMYLEMLKNNKGNSLTGSNIICTGNNNLVYTHQDKKIVIDNIDDLIVIESDVWLYITTRGNSQWVKKFIS